MTGVERYASARAGWEVPAELDVEPELVRRLSSWDMWSGEPLPEEASAMIDDRVLAQFSVAGDARECGGRLLGLAREHPAVTGFRLKLPPLTEADSFATYRSIIEGVAAAVGAPDKEGSGATTLSPR